MSLISLFPILSKHDKSPFFSPLSPVPESAAGVKPETASHKDFFTIQPSPICCIFSSVCFVYGQGGVLELTIQINYRHASPLKLLVDLFMKQYFILMKRLTVKTEKIITRYFNARIYEPFQVRHIPWIPCIYKEPLYHFKACPYFLLLLTMH